jgi:small subunit ribosomal protein S1
VESPAEVVRPGDELKVKILEVEDARRRLSLSVKRVEGQELPTREPSDDVIIEDAEPPEGLEPPPAEDASADEAASAEGLTDEPPAEDSTEEPPAEDSTDEPPAEDSTEEPPAEEPPPNQD